MSAVGPQLPPHLLAKRKREDDDSHYPSPSLTKSATVSPGSDDTKRRRTHGPLLPYTTSPPGSPSPASNDQKSVRTIGPSLPPAPLDTLPTATIDNNDSSDDDFGPSPPPAPGSLAHHTELQRQKDKAAEQATSEAARKPQREEWMLVPPKGDDWSSRVDPTKLKNRKFNTGKGSKTPNSKGSKGIDSVWTETPEEKIRRLEDEVMGVKKAAQLDDGEDDARAKAKREEARATEKRIREYNEKNRGGSLYNEHKKTAFKEKEDDPSKRAFDWEKDMAGGVKIGHAQKKEMLNRAADFGSRFAGGNYL